MANFLEGPDDGNYAYNACRVPMRLGAHFAVSGDQRAHETLQKMNLWLKAKALGDPERINPGYTLAGVPLATDYTTMAFTAPFGVAAMVDASNQAWLDAIWNDAVGFLPESYFEDSLRLLSMIVMSGNWWSPTAAESCSP